MGQMLVVTLREGIEMFLIVAIAAAYLRKTGRAVLLPAVWWGAGAAALASIVLGVWLAGGAGRPLPPGVFSPRAGAAALASIVLGVWLAEVAVLPFRQGVLALVAAALVISMVIYMLKAAKHMRTEIGARLEAASQRPGAGAWLGIFLFTVLMITR